MCADHVLGVVVGKQNHRGFGPDLGHIQKISRLWGMTKTDYHKLDDTLAGQLVQAGAVAASVALPDYVASKSLRAVANVGLLAGLGWISAKANLLDGDPDNDPDAIFAKISDLLERDDHSEDEAMKVTDLGGPAKTWAIIGGGLGLFAASAQLGSVSQAAVAKRMGKAGIMDPNTVLGLLAAAGVFIASRMQK